MINNWPLSPVYSSTTERDVYSDMAEKNYRLISLKLLSEQRNQLFIFLKTKQKGSV